MKYSAGRRQKKKSRRTADTFPRAYEAAALRKIRAAVSFCFSDRCSCDQEGGIWEDTAMSILVIHSTHELHQLKKVLLLLRGDMTTYRHYHSN